MIKIRILWVLAVASWLVYFAPIFFATEQARKPLQLIGLTLFAVFGISAVLIRRRLMRDRVVSQAKNESDSDAVPKS